MVKKQRFSTHKKPINPLSYIFLGLAILCIGLFSIDFVSAEGLGIFEEMFNMSVFTGGNEARLGGLQINVTTTFNITGIQQMIYANQSNAWICNDSLCSVEVAQANFSGRDAFFKTAVTLFENNIYYLLTNGTSEIRWTNVTTDLTVANLNTTFFKITNGSQYGGATKVNEIFDIVGIFFNVPFTEVSQTFTTPTTEGSTDTFVINLTYNNVDYINIAGSLFYNGTEHIGAKTGTGSNVEFTTSLTIPLLDGSVNNTFYWEITQTNSTDTLISNSTFNNQSVLTIGIDNCEVHKTLILNLTLKDEELKNKLNATFFNSSIEVDIEFFSFGTSIRVINLSQAYFNTSNVSICINDDLNGTEYEMDATIRYNGDKYANELYHFQKFNVTNTTTSTIPQHIDLFDLLDSATTVFLITVKGINFLPVKDALIQITRRYVSDGVFRTVEIPKTDDNGQTKGHFDTDGAIYTIIVSQNGTIISTFSNVVVICSNIITEDCQINLDAGAAGAAFTNYSQLGGINFQMIFNSTLRRITTTFTTADGSSKTVLVNATKFDMFQNTSVCSDTLSSSSGTLICDVPASFGNVTIVAELFVNGELITTRYFSIIPDPRETFGNEGMLMVLIMMITLPLIAITDKIGMIVMIILGLISMGGLLMYTGGGLGGATSSVIWFIVAGGILIWKISRTG